MKAEQRKQADVPESRTEQKKLKPNNQILIIDISDKMPDQVMLIRHFSVVCLHSFHHIGAADGSLHDQINQNCEYESNA